MSRVMRCMLSIVELLSKADIVAWVERQDAKLKSKYDHLHKVFGATHLPMRVSCELYLACTAPIYTALRVADSERPNLRKVVKAVDIAERELRAAAAKPPTSIELPEHMIVRGVDVLKAALLSLMERKKDIISELSLAASMLDPSAVWDPKVVAGDLLLLEPDGGTRALRAVLAKHYPGEEGRLLVDANAFRA